MGDGGASLKWNGTRWTVQALGGTLNAVWGSDVNNVWSAGDSGGNNAWVLKWNGSAWDVQTLGSTENQIFGGCSIGPNDVWLSTGSNAAMWHWNGSAWTSYSAPISGSYYQAMWGSDASNVWAVGHLGSISKWDGSNWTSQSSGTNVGLYGIWGADASNIWTVGGGGTIRKWNGSTWMTQSSGTTNDLRGVWGTAANNVWAVGDGGTIIKWDGSAWTAQSSGVSANLRDVWVDPSTNYVWAAGSTGFVLTTASEVPPAAPDILAATGATSLTDGASTVAFGSVTVGVTGETKTFTITNPGGLNLTGLSVTKDGTHASDFTIGALGSTTVAPGGSTSFTVTFTPSSAGGRVAAIHIASNVSGSKNPFDINLAGQQLASNQDTDGDGLNDAAEFQLAALGYDWQVSQASLVSTLFTNASGAGLYTSSQMQGLNVGTPLLFRDNSGQFKLTIGLLKATDLLNFTPLPFTAPETAINGQGKIEFLFTVPDSSAFFRLQSQ